MAAVTRLRSPVFGEVEVIGSTRRNKLCVLRMANLSGAKP